MASRVLTFEGPGILATVLWYWVAYANLCWKLNLRCTQEKWPGHPERAIYRSINPTPSRPWALSTCWPWIWQELNLWESDLSQKHYSPQAHWLEYCEVSPNQLTPSEIGNLRHGIQFQELILFIFRFFSKPRQKRQRRNSAWKVNEKLCCKGRRFASRLEEK